MQVGIANAMADAIVSPRTINEIVMASVRSHLPCRFVSAPSSVSRMNSGTDSKSNAILASWLGKTVVSRSHHWLPSLVDIHVNQTIVWAQCGRPGFSYRVKLRRRLPPRRTKTIRFRLILGAEPEVALLLLHLHPPVGGRTTFHMIDLRVPARVYVALDAA